MFLVTCQVDLGSFSLGQNKRGDLKFIFNQAANILGFGGDRGIDLTIGEGLFNAKGYLLIDLFRVTYNLAV